MKSKPGVALFASFLFAACGGDPAAQPSGTHVHADGTVHQDPPKAAPDADAHAHVDRQALGELKVGEHVLHVFQVVPAIEPGKEGDFDLDFAAGKPLPDAVRGWIGLESAVGSRKVRFAKETDTRMHGHPEAPSPLPDGSKLWIEIERAGGADRSSIAYR